MIRAIILRMGSPKTRLPGWSFIRFSTAAVAALVVLTMYGCSSSISVASRWTDQELRVASDDAAWKEETKRIAGPDVYVSVRNDQDHLYLCLTTTSLSTQMQMLGLGTTVWFDPEGQKNRTFGIEFPVSGLLQGRRFPSREDPDELQRLVQLAGRGVTILGPGENDRLRMPLIDAKGIEAHLSFADGTLTYELKVPLRKTVEQPYAVGAEPGKPVAVGLETGDMSQVRTAQPSASSRPSGGGGRGGGRGGGGGQAGRSLGSDAPEPLRHWLMVNLAAGK
jgi:hypothetical protein